MGKVSPVSAKYIITTKIQIEGSVDRPDVIGAIFGQTEGFLGSDLELRELQRSGKIGRIEVNLNTINGKASGEIIIPSSLDKAETAIIAAALETIERIGPCNSKVRVEKIEDVRTSKRDFVVARAKQLLKELQSNVLPDSQEITEEVAASVRMMEITEWGPERLPAGPGIDDSEEVILVEGRADVLNLLKQGIKNVVALNGTSVPSSIRDLCKQKVITIFVDGDRGGDLIIRELLSESEVDYAVKAPSGKEVEELTKKEIHLALRGKVAAAQFKFDANGHTSNISVNQRRKNEIIREVRDRNPRSRTPETYPRDNRIPIKSSSDLNEKDKLKFKEMLDELVGTRGAFILDKDYSILGKVPTSELETTLKSMKDVHAVVLDGVISREITTAAEMSNANYVVAMNSRVRPNETRVKIITSRDL